MVTKQIIYQLLLRVFGERKCSPNGSYEENGSGKFNDITERYLAHLRDDLGIDIVWYTGVIDHATQTSFPHKGGDYSQLIKGKAGSPYAIRDYYDVAPELAVNCEKRMEEFEALIERTHKAGLKVIIDFIPNHLYRAYKSKTDNFDQRNFYTIPGELEFNGYKEYPAFATGNDCFSLTPSVNDWYETIKLNYENNYTWSKMLNILYYWASKGVDGFRCDMVELVPIEFFRWAIKSIRGKHPDIIFVAEAYNKSRYSEYIDAGFTYLYDKSGFYDSLRAVSASCRPAYWLTDEWQFLGDMQPKMLNFLENHDEQRLASDFFLGSGEKGIAPLMVSLLFNTAAFMLYFGQEYGERGMQQEGFSGIDGRTSIFDYCALSPKEEGCDKLYSRYSELLKIAKDPIFSRGDTYDLMYCNPTSSHFNQYKQFAFMRGDSGNTALVVVNFDSVAVDVKINIPKEAYEFFDIDPIEEYEKIIHIEPYDGVIIR